MATIRPSSDLRNKYTEISDFCNKYNEPVFITKNGTGDLVVLSNAEYERLCGKHELHRLLFEGLDCVTENSGVKAEDVFSEIESEYGFGEV
jgi:prevent-host-death family protein